ncbi:MAG TPA: hypothetical protein VM260_12550, partial [Pirellula sp.]|nr:hypothetical protein [Pirellula sp.]
NGFDDDGNQTPDDSVEEQGGEPAWLVNAAIPNQFQGITAWHHNDMQEDFNGDGAIDANDVPFGRKYSRQIYSRHLYCLMMLLKDKNPAFVDAALNPPDPNNSDQIRMTARNIAQWAVNIVDFRDADAIMTPFEYDSNPFNGWSIDGVLGSSDDSTAERGLVWGAEAPDLLISEALATHDKRAKDTAIDAMKHKRGDKKPDDDEDLDQFRIPEGSLFVELYCPRARQGNNISAPASLANSSGYPRELYSFDATSSKWYLDLGRYHTTPDANGVKHPVWRIAISQNHKLASNPTGPLSAYTRGLSNYDTTTFDPESMNAIDQLNHTTPSPSRLNIERQVWFTKDCEPPANTPEAANTFVNVSASAFILP